MKLEAVVICVRYDDFLAWTLPLNKHFFDRLVVVTDTKDERTKKLCEYWHVQCIQTDVFYEDGSPFNKGAAINVGLKALDGDAWVLHMDADIVLPPMFRHILEGIKLDPQGLYHADRLMCDSFDKWLNYFMRPVLSNEANTYVHPRPFPLGVRLNKSDFGGWVPLGFFQMWNQGEHNLAYPTRNDDAGHSDLRFSQLFSREHRHMLSEFFVIHLETKLAGDNKMGSNWKGRKTPPFAPTLTKEDVVDEDPALTPVPDASAYDVKKKRIPLS
jgi:glycosyltransferase involved in cell wall biosynthesis